MMPSAQDVAEVAKQARETLPAAAQYPMIIALVAVVVIAIGALWVAILTVRHFSKSASELAKSFENQTNRLGTNLETQARSIEGVSKKSDNLSLDLEGIKRKLNGLEEKTDELLALGGDARKAS